LSDLLPGNPSGPHLFPVSATAFRKASKSLASKPPVRSSERHSVRTPVFLDVLVQRAARSYVDQLQSAANRENRQVALQGLLQQGDLV